MMARRHNSRSSSSQAQEKSNDENVHQISIQPIHERHSIQGSMMTKALQNARSMQRIKCFVCLFLIAVLTSLLTNNIGGQTQHNAKGRKSINNSVAETELLQALYNLQLPTNKKELIELNEELAGMEPKFILLWAHHTLLTKNSGMLRGKENNGLNLHPFVQVTSFGPTGLVILDQLSKYNLLDEVPVITMDTLHLFQASYTFYETVQSHYNSTLHLTITKPVHIAPPSELHGDSFFKGYISSKEEFHDIYSPTLWKTDPKYYTKLTKIDPLEQKLEDWQTIMWITGRRRSQGGEREDLSVLEFESVQGGEVNDQDFSDENPFHSSKGRWKLNPLAYWSYDDVWSYIKENKVPYNHLYDLGFTSIGDEMTSTLPRKSHFGDPMYERSGRFNGLNRTECGLHSHLNKIKALKKQKEESGEELAIPELECKKCIEVDESNFSEAVYDDPQDNSLLLLEFYSPFCGSCQEFAPVMNRLANNMIPKVKVARFDITEQSIPKYNEQEVFQVEATPTLYVVSYSPSFHAQVYSGKHEFDAILQWIIELTNKK